MDWGLVSTILASIFFVAMVVLAIRLSKKKKPVWAYRTKKIIGLGADAPPELELTFKREPVARVYQTAFIFFNRGNEAIRKDDVTKGITVHFRGAKILREPNIKAKSKEEIEFSASQVVDHGQDSIQLDFLYLGHNDGAVVEVVHTGSEQVDCSGNIIDASEIVNIGVFDAGPQGLYIARAMTGLAMVIGGFALVSHQLVTAPLEEPSKLLWGTLVAMTGLLLAFMPEIRNSFHYRKFPRWSATADLEKQKRI